MTGPVNGVIFSPPNNRFPVCLEKLTEKKLVISAIVLFLPTSYMKMGMIIMMMMMMMVIKMMMMMVKPVFYI